MAGVPSMGLGVFQSGGDVSQRRVSFPPRYIFTEAAHRCHCCPSSRPRITVHPAGGGRDRGPACVLLKFRVYDCRGCYKLLDKETGRAIYSRDVT